MFWQTKAVEESSLEQLLKKDPIVLTDVLEDPLLLQSLRIGDRNLLDYLTREDVLLEIMNLALRPAIDSSLAVEKQYRQSLISSEILSASTDEVVEAIFSSEVVLSVITDFMSDSSPVNHLIASFYMKIVSQLLSRNPEKMLEVLEGGNFINRAVEHLHLSAIAELLLRLITTSYEEHIGHKIKTWCVGHSLVENCIALLDPSFPSAVHDNVNYLWTELTRTLRENLYTQDDRQDPLLERLQMSERIEELVAKITRFDSCDGMCSSVIVNICGILTVLLETNFIPDCPSQQLSDDRCGGKWSGGIPGESQHFPPTTEIWQPDAQRLVESVLARHVEKILNLAIEDLESENRGKSWFSLLEIVVELCDTSYFPTHQLLLEGFRKGKLQNLFALAVKQPTMSIFHKQLHKIVAYILYTKNDHAKPLLNYLFEELDIIGMIEAYINPTSPPFAPLELICIRSFHGNLAELIVNSTEFGPNRDLILQIIKRDERWSRIQAVVNSYREMNKPQACMEPLSMLLSSRCAPNEQQVVASGEEEFFAPVQSMLVPLEMKMPLSKLSKKSSGAQTALDQTSITHKNTGSGCIPTSLNDPISETPTSSTRQWLNMKSPMQENGFDDDWPNSSSVINKSKENQAVADPFADWPQAMGTTSFDQLPATNTSLFRVDDNAWPDVLTKKISNGKEQNCSDALNENSTDLALTTTSNANESDTISSLNSDEATLSDDEWALFSSARTSTLPNN